MNKKTYYILISLIIVLIIGMIFLVNNSLTKKTKIIYKEVKNKDWLRDN